MATQDLNKKILIVEDEIAMREIVAHKLSNNGFTVVQAGDGKEGLEKIISEGPALVLLDLMLPEMDGFEVLEQVRHHSDKKIASTPIIVLSNLWSNKDILKTKALNVQAYMVKAYYDTEEILKKVNQVLSAPDTKA